MLAALDESATRRRWGQQEELLATLVEVNVRLYDAFVYANSDPKKRGKPPQPFNFPRPFPRPGESTAKSKAVRPAALARAMTGGR